MSDRVPRCRVRAPSSLPACAFAALLLACVPAGLAQTVGGTWFNDGPRPAHNGQVENIPNRPVTGAIEALAPHPSNPDILYAASVGGGIWRTSNATAAAPSWTHQTPNFSVLAMGAIGFDPSDATHQTLVAGTGCFSSYGSCGTLLGMMRTTDGGNNWSVLNPGGPLATRSIRAVIARGSTLLAATNAGIYRSINTGSSFTLISGATGSGLPAGNSSDLVGRPGAPATLYTTVISGSAPGVYRSLDAGATWSKVSSSAMDTNLARRHTRPDRGRRARPGIRRHRAQWEALRGLSLARRNDGLDRARRTPDDRGRRGAVWDPPRPARFPALLDRG